MSCPIMFNREPKTCTKNITARSYELEDVVKLGRSVLFKLHNELYSNIFYLILNSFLILLLISRCDISVEIQNAVL